MSDEVLEYAKCTVDIYFQIPKAGEAICCDRCPLLETYARKQCRRTGEYILDSRTRGMWCPLEVTEIVGGEKNK